MQQENCGRRKGVEAGLAARTLPCREAVRLAAAAAAPHCAGMKSILSATQPPGGLSRRALIAATGLGLGALLVFIGILALIEAAHPEQVGCAAFAVD